MATALLLSLSFWFMGTVALWQRIGIKRPSQQLIDVLLAGRRLFNVSQRYTAGAETSICSLFCLPHDGDNKMKIQITISIAAFSQFFSLSSSVSFHFDCWFRFRRFIILCVFWFHNLQSKTCWQYLRVA